MATARAGGGELLIRGATLISPEREQPLADAWVLVRDGRIAGVGHGEPPPEVQSVPDLDATGRFLTPGLIDAHVHLDSIPGMEWRDQQAQPELAAAYRDQLPRSFLHHGFTTLIDLGAISPDSLARFQDRDDAPEVHHCGGPLPVAGGYPMLFAPEELRPRIYPNLLFDPERPESFPPGLRPEDHGAVPAVARVAAAGGRCVKTYVEDGFGLARLWPVPSAELLREVAMAARDRGLPLLVHANSFDAYTRGLEGDAQIFVHGLWTWDDHQNADSGEGLPTSVRELLDRLVARRVAVMPTLQVLAGDQALFDPAFLEDPKLSRVVPEGLIDWYGSEAGQAFGRRLLADQPPDSQTPEALHAAHDAPLSRAERVTRYLAERGGLLLFGSDTPSGPSYGNPPGYNGLLELRRLAAAGVPLATLLEAATLGNARAFGLDDRVGSVEVGKVADLLLLKADPLRDVKAYDAIEAVVLRGRVMDRESLAVEALPEGTGS